jgi:hypothetical protein
MAMTDIAPRVCVRTPGSDFNPYAGGTPEVCLVPPVNAFVKRDRSNDRITTMLAPAMIWEVFNAYFVSSCRDGS